LKFATDVGRVGGQVAQQLDHVGIAEDRTGQQGVDAVKKISL
jgi:hypothetical protein